MKYLPMFLTLLLCHITFAQQGTEYQIFTINSSRDTILIGREGTEISVPALAFTDSSGQVFEQAPITILLKEVYDRADMILEGVSTESEEGILISDGMVEIRGRLGEMPVLIHPQRPLKVTITSWSGVPGMELYQSADSLAGALWEERTGELEMDTCVGYRMRYVYGERQVSKKEFRHWKKEERRKEKAARKQWKADKRTFLRRSRNGSSSNGVLTEGMFGGGIRYTRFRRDERTDRQYKYSIVYLKDSIQQCIKNQPITYSFLLNAFGWNNIDKLWVVKGRKPLWVEASNPDLKAFAFLPNRNVCLESVQNNSNHRFGRLPSEEPIIIVVTSPEEPYHIWAAFFEVSPFTTKITLGKLESMTKGAFGRKIRSYYEN